MTPYNVLQAMYRALNAKRQEIVDPGSGGTVRFFPVDFPVLRCTTAGTRTLDAATNYGVGEQVTVMSTIAGVVISASSISYTLNAGDWLSLTVTLGPAGTNVWSWADGTVFTNSVQSQAAGNATLTIAQVLAGYFTITGSGTSTLTMPTAANMIGAFANPSVGQVFRLTLNNNSDNTVTLGAGGSTLEGSAATIATTAARDITFQITNVGTPAYTACLVI